MPRMSKDEELMRLMRRQLSRVESTVRVLRASGCMTEVQEIYEQFALAAKGGKGGETEATLTIFCESMRHTLVVHGATGAHAAWLAALARENLEAALEGHVNFDLALARAVAEWKAITKNGLRQRGRSVAYARLVTAGGAIVFDAAKLSQVSPLPTFLIASIVAGAALFFQGVDKLVGD